jgi:hypothetical protein
MAGGKTMRSRRMYLAAGLLPLALVVGASREAELSTRQKALARARMESARVSYETHLKLFQFGEIVADDLYTWSRHLLDSQRDVAVTADERAAAYTGHLARMTAIKKSLDALGPKEDPAPGAIQSVDYWIKEAEYWLAVNR